MNFRASRIEGHNFGFVRKSVGLAAVFSMLVIQFVHAAVLEFSHTHHVGSPVEAVHYDAALAAHHDDHHHAQPIYGEHEGHDHDDHQLGALHDILHDLQNIATAEFDIYSPAIPYAIKMASRLPDSWKGISHRPPIPPPLA